MRRLAEAWRRAGKTIAFVPTMGYLHEGHARLLRRGRRRGEVLVLSIFVNPLQFGPHEDFERYPRDPRRDLALARREGVDVVFMPERGDLIPPGAQTHVEVERLTRGLCGASRPGHFRGVTTIVAKLFHLVRPHVALFGEKDYQQLAAIRQMVRDLDFGLAVVGVPIVRDRDGLALSSRNRYLSREERERALSLSRGLRRARDLYRRGERRPAPLVRAVRGVLEATLGARIDYVELVDAQTLEPARDCSRPALLATAVWIGKTRLIDNLILD